VPLVEPREGISVPTGSRDQQFVVAARIGNRSHANKLALIASL
jgi:hypothetical protein